MNTYNAEVRRLQMVVDSARSHIRAMAEAVAGTELDGVLTGQHVGRFRELANNRALLGFMWADVRTRTVPPFSSFCACDRPPSLRCWSSSRAT